MFLGFLHLYVQSIYFRTTRNENGIRAVAGGKEGVFCLCSPDSRILRTRWARAPRQFLFLFPNTTLCDQPALAVYPDMIGFG